VHILLYATHSADQNQGGRFEKPDLATKLPAAFRSSDDDGFRLDQFIEQFRSPSRF
jgi:hypothetical protein